jgi:hypothetical protein
MDAGKISQRRVVYDVLRMQFLWTRIYEISAGGSRSKTAHSPLSPFLRHQPFFTRTQITSVVRLARDLQQRIRVLPWHFHPNGKLSNVNWLLPKSSNRPLKLDHGASAPVGQQPVKTRPRFIYVQLSHRVSGRCDPFTCLIEWGQSSVKASGAGRVSRVVLWNKDVALSHAPYAPGFHFYG